MAAELNHGMSISRVASSAGDNVLHEWREIQSLCINGLYGYAAKCACGSYMVVNCQSPTIAGDEFIDCQKWKFAA